jgi:uncharacterized Tic20 family protein
MSDASDPTQPQAGGQTQPGWYPDPTSGQLRWWDGQTWGAYQSGAAPVPGAAPMGATGVADPRQTAMWAHYAGAAAMFLTCGGLGWVGPLIVYATSGAKDPFVKEQSAEALNFQIMLAIGCYISYALSIILIGLIPLFVFWLVGIIIPIMGGQAASRGENYRYPFSLRLVSGT